VIANEVDAYIRANSSGRAAYAVAAADLDCLESQVLAVALLKSLSESTQPGSVRWYGTMVRLRTLVRLAPRLRPSPRTVPSEW
jgi:hypothetical protein